jgi:hypothetical protein
MLRYSLVQSSSDLSNEATECLIDATQGVKSFDLRVSAFKFDPASRPSLSLPQSRSSTSNSPPLHRRPRSPPAPHRSLHIGTSRSTNPRSTSSSTNRSCTAEERTAALPVRGHDWRERISVRTLVGPRPSKAGWPRPSVTECPP